MSISKEIYVHIDRVSLKIDASLFSDGLLNFLIVGENARTRKNPEQTIIKMVITIHEVSHDQDPIMTSKAPVITNT